MSYLSPRFSLDTGRNYRSGLVSSLGDYSETSSISQVFTDLSISFKGKIECLFDEINETLSEMRQSCINPPVDVTDEYIRDGQGSIVSLNDRNYTVQIFPEEDVKECQSTCSDDERKFSKSEVLSEEKSCFEFMDEISCQSTRTQSINSDVYECGLGVYENKNAFENIRVEQTSNAARKDMKCKFEMEYTCFDTDQNRNEKSLFSLTINEQNKNDEFSQTDRKTKKSDIVESVLGISDKSTLDKGPFNVYETVVSENQVPSPVRLIRIISKTTPQPSRATGTDSEVVVPEPDSEEEWINPLFNHQSNPRYDNFFSQLKFLKGTDLSPLDGIKSLPISPSPYKDMLIRDEELLPRPPRLSPAMDKSVSNSSKSSYDNFPPDDSGFFSCNKASQDKEERYVKYKEIGEGGFGRVFLATDTRFQERVVLKELEQEKIRLEQVTEEICILNRFPHDNIMKLLDHYSTLTHYCMVYEFQSQLSLFEYLRHAGKQEESTCKTILRQVMNALDWLHDNMVVHGDIKDENMIIEPETRNIILIDFGSAKLLEEAYEPITFRGTKVYSPPEAIVGDIVYGQSVDIWTIGTLVYVVLNNKRPFIDDQEILNACIPYPKNWSEGARDFVRQCLNREYLDRPTVKYLQLHPWIYSKI